MKTSIVYRRCRDIRLAMAQDGFFTEMKVQWNDIEPYVAMHCGADPRTLDKYRHYITYFGFFKEVRRGIFVLCERDKFGNAITQQADFALLNAVAHKPVPKRNY